MLRATKFICRVLFTLVIFLPLVMRVAAQHPVTIDKFPAPPPMPSPKPSPSPRPPKDNGIDHRRVIVVISDGEDNFSEIVKKAIGDTSQEQNTATPQARRLVHNRMLLEVQRELQKADATFYSINPSGPGLRLNVISQRAQDGMAELATSTGGTSFVPEKLEDLDAVFRQITAELRSQYLLQYYSKSEAPSGTFLAIGVQVPKRSDLKIRARQGYYVKRK